VRVAKTAARCSRVGFLKTAVRQIEVGKGRRLIRKCGYFGSVETVALLPFKIIFRAIDIER